MVKYDPDKHHRRSIRLKNHYYASAGIYFVTVCVQNRKPLFGTVVDDTIELNEAGQMVQSGWKSLSVRFPGIEMDEFVVMPNHFHGILVIHEIGFAGGDWASLVGASTPNDPVGEPPAGTSDTRPALGEMIGAFKSITTHQYIQGVRQIDWPSFDGRLWQRNYWEHIIRNNESLAEIRRYIQTNPLSWLDDELHPDAPPFNP